MPASRNKLAGPALQMHRSRVKTSRWLAVLWIAIVGGLPGQDTEPSLPRPGAIVVLDVTGEAQAGVNEERRPIKADERLRVGSTVTTGRRSLASLVLSNGALIHLGSESELEVEEFGQAPISGSPKFVELREEPTISRTRLRLIRGDVKVEVKPLKVSRGSSFMLATVAGTVRLSEGTVQAILQMSDLGLGVCSVEFEKGAAEFELVGGNFVPVPPGRKLAFAVEIDKTSGTPKISEMPKETPKAK